MNPMNQHPFASQPPIHPSPFQQPPSHQPIHHSKSMYPEQKNITNTEAAKKHRKQYWINYQHQNQKTGNELHFPGYDIRKDSTSYLLTITKLTQIPLKDIQGDLPPERDAKYSLEYSITLFNKESSANGNYYGRTYRSKPIPLREVNGFWESAGEDFVYFHTSFTEKSSIAVVECSIIKEHRNLKTYGCLGFALCNIFESQVQTTVDITKGSARTIGQLIFLQEPSRGPISKLTFDIRVFPQFNLMKQLIPQNCFCGSQDQIPGLQNSRLPNPRDNSGHYLPSIKIDSLPRETIYIHNIQMISSPALENRFESFLKQLNQERAGKIGAQQVNKNVHVSERRILVSIHNTWHNITQDSYVSMLAPDRQGILHSGGSLTIKNFIDHPLIALLFRVEYKVVFPGERANELLHFTIGWQCYLPQLKRSGQILEDTIEDEFVLGPGKSPSGELLWSPNATDMSYYQIKFKAQISSNPTPPRETFEDKLLIADKGAHSYQHSQSMHPTSYGPGQSQFGPPPSLPYAQGQQVASQFQTGPQNQYGQPGQNQFGPQSQNQPYPHPHQSMMSQEQEMKMRQLQAQLEVAERQAREGQLRAEQLEMERLKMQQQQRNQPNQYNGPQNQYGQLGGYGYGERQDPKLDEVRLLELQNQQKTQELEQMRREMQQVMSSIQDARQYQGQQQRDQYYNEINRQLSQPLPRDSAQQIAMIANVFYNMLNMIGEQERDSKMLGLSENLKKMIQQQRFDDLLAPKAPYVGMGAINLLKTTDLPIKDQVNFIKMGYGDLLQHPTAQITSTSINKDRLSLEIEQQDPLRASAINIKFICLKTPWHGMERLPNKFYFQLKFFTFPTIITDKVKIKPIHQGEPLRSGEAYYLTKENQSYGMTQTISYVRDTLSDPNLISLSFEVDPSISRIKDENIKLAEYLRERFLTVDIFDGDSLFLYGTCKIPLFEILRQGRPFVVRAKECEMCDPNTGDFKGAIQVIIGNQGRAASIYEDQSHKIKELSINSPLKTRVQPTQGQEEKKKFKKVVKSRPMDLTKVQQTNNLYQSGTFHQQSQDFRKSILSQTNEQEAQYAAVANADLRKKLRVDRVRKMQMGETSGHMSVEDPSQPDWQKMKSLKEIELIRETKKDQVISNVISEYITDQFQLSVISGQLEFVTVKLFNPYNQNEVFTIKIQDEDEHLLTERELKVVTDQNEWRHWVSLGKCKKPLRWDCVTQTGDIILQPNEEIDVLFKYFTLREADLSPITGPTAETVKRRNIKIIFFQSKGTAHQTIDVTIVPSSAPIDHIFRYYEPENSHVTIKIPPFVQLNYPGLTALVSRPNSHVDISKETSWISIEAKTEGSPSITEMTLYLYGDQYKEDLLATVKIEIYALITIYSKIKAGIQRNQTLALPSEHARTVQIFSSEPRCVYRSRKDDQQIRLIPQSVNYIQVCAKIFSSTQQKVRVHCVDTQSGELIYSWLMIIDSENPKITGTESFYSKTNMMSVQKMQFTNKLNLRTVYEFATSRPDIVKPKEETLMFEPKEFKPISLEFLPQKNYGTADVFLYASDQDQNICECILLKLAYMP